MGTAAFTWRSWAPRLVSLEYLWKVPTIEEEKSCHTGGQKSCPADRPEARQGHRSRSLISCRPRCPCLANRFRNDLGYKQVFFSTERNSFLLEIMENFSPVFWLFLYQISYKIRNDGVNGHLCETNRLFFSGIDANLLEIDLVNARLDIFP